ncbi:stAR-related lipid transfer protein 3-like isoform X2 [Montipora foliosa]|uniref:stAR-related lipid transfer protein 3-like isoform X2 n=1 Tax=Montipora foliosa TaxID=591990 RepID=UPI0035F1BB4A
MNVYDRCDAEIGSQDSAAGSLNHVSHPSGTCRPFFPARRLFCLLTVFDFLAAVVIWLLYANSFSDQEPLKDTLNREVVRCTFKESLFDIVLLAFGRMVVLLLAYALCVSRKWYCVAVTTAITTAVLIAKAAMTKLHSHDNKPTLYYLLVLSSLVLSWVETWVLDVKVIPTEIKAQQRIQQEAVERRSLIPSDYLHGHLTPHSLFSERSFYTPHASDDENETEYQENPTSLGISPQDQQFIEKSKETMEATWHLMSINDGWKTEKQKDGIVVESRVIPSGRKIYRLKSSLDGKTEDIFNLIVLRPDMAHKWGGSITDSYVVRQIDDQTDIVYNSTGEEGGGMVSSRGENGPGGWAFREAEGNPNRTEYVWLFNVDLKGWLPQSVTDIAMAHMLYQTGQGVRNYVRESLGCALKN